MSAEFWITTAAIVVGPIFAVLITYKLQRSNDQQQRRLAVFRSLMATRKTQLSPERVQALNLVEVEFYGKSSVLAKFKSLIETYNDQQRWRSTDVAVLKAVNQEVDDRTVQLLDEMGKVLGYRLASLELLRGGYYPEAFSQLEYQQQQIREFLVGLNSGQKVVPTAVVDVRHPDAILKQAQETQQVLEYAIERKKEADS